MNNGTKETLNKIQDLVCELLEKHDSMIATIGEIREDVKAIKDEVDMQWEEK